MLTRDADFALEGGETVPSVEGALEAGAAGRVARRSAARVVEAGQGDEGLEFEFVTYRREGR